MYFDAATSVYELLVANGLAIDLSDAKRALANGEVYINDYRVSKPFWLLPPQFTIKRGKRRFVQVDLGNVTICGDPGLCAILSKSAPETK